MVLFSTCKWLGGQFTVKQHVDLNEVVSTDKKFTILHERPFDDLQTIYTYVYMTFNSVTAIK